MIRAVLALLGLCLFLQGCVLQSQSPLFAENTGGKLIPKDGVHYAVEGFIDGAWKREDGFVAFTRVGHHYSALNEKNDTIEVLFADLGKGWWVMQAQEKGKPFTYLLVQPAKDALNFHLLTCDSLKKNKAVAADIIFKDSDCQAGKNVTRDTFVKLAATPDKASMRLVPVGK